MNIENIWNHHLAFLSKTSDFPFQVRKNPKPPPKNSCDHMVTPSPTCHAYRVPKASERTWPQTSKKASVFFGFWVFGWTPYKWQEVAGHIGAENKPGVYRRWFPSEVSFNESEDKAETPKLRTDNYWAWWLHKHWVKVKIRSLYKREMIIFPGWTRA